METKNVNGKPCLLESSLINELDVTDAVFGHIIRKSQAVCYERKDGKWYPLSSVLMIMSAAGYPKPDFNRISQVATEMIDAASPSKEKLDEIMEILSRETPSRKKAEKPASAPYTVQQVMPGFPADEKPMMNQVEAGRKLGITKDAISILRKKHPEAFPTRKGPRGSWLYTEEDIEMLKPLVEDYLAKRAKREANAEKRAEKKRQNMDCRGIGIESPFTQDSPFEGISNPFSQNGRWD